nr:hypothetical protein [Kofleriaceae bacterium]
MSESVEIVGLEARRSDLARGIVIARARVPLDADTQRSLWLAMEAFGATESDDDEDDEDDDDDPPRQWLAAPWLPPAPGELDAHRLAIVELSERYGLDGIWFVKVETGIDGVAWRELMAAAEPVADDDPFGDEPTPTADPPEIVDAIFDEQAEVLYSAPDAPLEPQADGDDADDTDDADADDDADDGGRVIDPGPDESHWRNGSPPFESAVPFPLERYPDILTDYDAECFGVALKLAGDRMPGEESIINAFFALWLSVYQDERAEDIEPFQRADVVHDRTHRSALMWVEKLAVPATASDQVHFLMWILARLHEVIPIAWARFEEVDEGVKARASGDDTDPLVLAGNPFADRFERHGEEAALAWAVGQSAWSRRELAGMLVEVALRHDPDDPAAAPVAERLLRRALAFDAKSDATGYLAIVLVRQLRVAEAIALAKDATPDVKTLVVGDTAEHAPGEVPATLELLDASVAGDPEELADLAATLARHAPQHLGALLDRLPHDAALVPNLYNASFSVERPEGLQILRFVLSLPEPAAGTGEPRTAYVMAWNNACIHAHALGDYDLATELADGAQRFAAENPYIHHSAACAYAATGQTDRALAQVQFAIDRGYEHAEKMETDADLATLQIDPRFAAVFSDWRTKRADLN